MKLGCAHLSCNRNFLARKKIFRASTGFEPMALYVSATVLYQRSYEDPFIETSFPVTGMRHEMN